MMMYLSLSYFVKDLNDFYCRFDCLNNVTDNLQCQECTQEGTQESTPVNNRIIVKSEKVKQVLVSIRTDKATGPDGVSGKTLKICSQQLVDVFQVLFQWSLDTSSIPSFWKWATIIPVPKIPKPKVLNDYRPVALTPIVMKCFEKIVRNILVEQTKDILDPLQFAYQPNRSVEDAIGYLLHTVCKHLERTGTYARVLFVDFSSAFNMIVPGTLVKKLSSVVNPKLCQWLRDFMTNRVQQVRFGNVMSQARRLSTGTPQGCVLSPILYTLLTSDFSCSTASSCHVVKYADDTCIIGLITNNDEVAYWDTVDKFVSWSEENSLVLNATKTHEMIFDYRKNGGTNNVPLYIDVQQVAECKYLGVVIDNKLKWDSNTKVILSKGNQRMYFLRKMKALHVKSDTMFLFYQCVIQSVICFCCLAWFNRAKLNRIVKHASRVIGVSVKELEDVAERALLAKLQVIVKDSNHPLHNEVVFNRSGRIRLPRIRTDRFGRSFLPSAMKVFNNNFCR